MENTTLSDASFEIFMAAVFQVLPWGLWRRVVLW